MQNCSTSSSPLRCSIAKAKAACDQTDNILVTYIENVSNRGISMYALSNDYAARVIAFIQRVKQTKNIRVEVNGLSTQLFGDYQDTLMLLLKKEMQQDLENGQCVFLVKIGPGELSKEKLPNIFKERIIKLLILKFKHHETICISCSLHWTYRNIL